MRISVLTMFPQMFDSFLQGPVVQRAVRKGSLEIEVVDIKEFAPGSYRHIDDSPFGGGAGMVMRCQPVLDALRSAENGGVKAGASVSAAMTPAGQPFVQKTARRYAELDHLILICGHYEGMDERIMTAVDEEISVGDYILSGGELPAMTITDSLIRLLDGTIRADSTAEESFENGLLEYPQYTRPASFQGMEVPEVLRSGHAEKIRRWRLKESLRKTMTKRPDLLEERPLNEEEQQLLEEIRNEGLEGN